MLLALDVGNTQTVIGLFVSAAAPRPPRAPGDTAPDFMLRAPASVTTLADDFFDGLIRPGDGER